MGPGVGQHYVVAAWLSPGSSAKEWNSSDGARAVMMDMWIIRASSPARLCDPSPAAAGSVVSISGAAGRITK